MKSLVLISLILVLSNLAFSWEIKLIKKIPVEDGAVLASVSFVVLEDGNFIFADFKDKDNQIKVINQEGKLIKTWGKMGPGPDEFNGASFLDYQKPYLAVADAGKYRIYVYENIMGYEFKKIGGILAWEREGPIKIYLNNVLIPGYVVSSAGKKFMLFMKDFNDRKTEYILPLENVYGARSIQEYKKIVEEAGFVLSIPFIDVYEDTIFYVRDKRLKVDKIDLKLKNLEIIGEEPKNFRALSVDKKTKNRLMDAKNQKSKKELDEIISRHSFVSGLVADKNFVAVIYVNKERRIREEFYWVPYVQIYDYSGKVLHEQSLEPCFSSDRVIPLYYEKDKRQLYLCSIISNEAAYQYEIYKFLVEQ